MRTVDIEFLKNPGDLQCMHCGKPAKIRKHIEDGPAVVTIPLCAKCATLPNEMVLRTAMNRT
jgi:hypothetical protein